MGGVPIIGHQSFLFLYQQLYLYKKKTLLWPIFQLLHMYSYVNLCGTSAKLATS